jgi:hypothetical protein
MKSNSIGKTILIAMVVGSCLFHRAYGQAADVPLAKQRVVAVNGKQYMLTSKLKSLLISNFFYHYNHDIGIPNMIETMKRIGTAEGWTVDVANTGDEVTATKLRGYQVFFGNYISSWASTNGFPAANKTAVQDWVEKQGGGVFIMHAAGDSRAGTIWPWYYNVAHPVVYTGEIYPRVPAPVFIPEASRSHPILQGLPTDTTIWEDGEWHKFSKTITEVYPKADVLYSMNGAKCAGCPKGSTSSFIGYDQKGGYPASWTFPAGKGAIGYFMEGHGQVTMNSMTKPVWDRFFKQFMYYIAGYDSTQVTTSIQSPAGFILDRSGVSFHPSDEAGVLISRPGAHLVSLFDMAGHRIKEFRGTSSPMDYDLKSEMKAAGKGVYVLRVITPGMVRSKRFFRG